MTAWSRCVLRVMAIAGGIWAVSAGAGAADFSLELKRLGPVDNAQMARTGLPADYVFRNVSSQSFFLQFLEKQKPEKDPRLANFFKIVTKEPKYNSEFPLRAVAQLGDKAYAFVLDSKDAKSKGYGRLYFDRNCNGDLTDDKPIDVEKPATEEKAEDEPSVGYTQSQFPRVDLVLDVQGTKIDYAFTLSVFSQVSGNFRYASASLSAAAYRQGDIVLDGKKRRVVLLDHNSNGRFNDDVSMVVMQGSGQIYSQMGDMLIIDADKPEANVTRMFDIAANNGHYVSKLLSVDGKYYDMKISPAGDKLSIEPSKAALGYVTSPHEGFSGAMYGDNGFVKIVCGKSQKATVPEGKWRLLSYTIDRTEIPPAKPAEKKDEAKKSEEGKSLFGALVEMVTGPSVPVNRIRYTMVSANGTGACKAIEVVKDKTVELPFGPPYKAAIEVMPGRTAKQIELSLSLTGAGGEVCSNMMVDGGRPAPPELTIKDPKGEIVESGKLKYG